MAAIDGNPSSAIQQIPPPSQAYLDKGYGNGSIPRTYTAPNSNTAATDFGSAPIQAAHPTEFSPLSQSVNQQNSGKFNEEWDASQRGSSIIDGNNMQRSNSVMSQGETLIPSRGGTLKKKASLRRGPSLKRSSSRRSSRAGSVRSLVLQPGGEIDEMHSAFFSPVPTSGNPTEILANRFQAWRKLLKDLITYFREIQTSYDHKAKSILKVSNVLNNTSTPTNFSQSGGIDEAAQILRAYHKSSVAEANKSKEIENDVILALVGLRSDLNQKIKEIKSLSGDFKNSVDKEMDSTRKAVNELQDGLGQSDVDPAATTGKKDPYLLKLAVDRQVERQIDEENYLHQAYLNLEASGRELEAIVVGEIQKAYNALAGILKREADAATAAVEELRSGPIAMPKDAEWDTFVHGDDHFVDPSIPVRDPQNIQYPGRDNELAQEVRAGLLERKSKYLKSYTAGWYVLSPTHLHEFKSADKSGAPIMSLFLPEQKLGSHSSEGASSNKFMLKGRQTGAMHRGHSWVFRCESHETMLAWYEDIKVLTEKSPQERKDFVRQHARSISGASKPGSISSDGIMDEEDEEPFSTANSAVVAQPLRQDANRRPQPGGRFPSDLNVETLSQRGLQAPLSPSSGSSGYADNNVAAAAALPGSGVGQNYFNEQNSPTHAAEVNRQAQEDGINPYTYQPINDQADGHVPPAVIAAAAGLGGAGLGAAGVEGDRHNQPQDEDTVAQENETRFNQQLEQQAAAEASVIAAPDVAPIVYNQEANKQAAQAAREATIIAAPDSIMSGGRSQGSLTALNSVIVDETKPHTAETLKKEVLNPLSDQAELARGRPSLTVGQSHQSVVSISQLHVPGEFPKSYTPAL